MAQDSFKSHISANNFSYSDWKICVQKSHILQSRCTCSSLFEVPNDGIPDKCDFCRYEKELDLPQLPDMTFASNVLRLEHARGFGIEFTSLEALRCVDSKNDLMKVAIAEAWQETRLDHPSIKDVVKPFDWTFSTCYKGTLLGCSNLKVCSTNEKIDIEKLKCKTKILFYDEIILFEDELADNGTAQCSVKIRVMPNFIFILMRYFLRIDNLMVRIIDTRVFYEENTNYFLREHVRRESRISDLKVPPSVLKNPQELWNHLPVVSSEYEKLEFAI